MRLATYTMVRGSSDSCLIVMMMCMALLAARSRPLSQLCETAFWRMLGTILNFVLCRGNCSKSRPTYDRGGPTNLNRCVRWILRS